MIMIIWTYDDSWLSSYSDDNTLYSWHCMSKAAMEWKSNSPIINMFSIRYHSIRVGEPVWGELSINLLVIETWKLWNCGNQGCLDFEEWWKTAWFLWDHWMEVHGTLSISNMLSLLVFPFLSFCDGNTSLPIWVLDGILSWKLPFLSLFGGNLAILAPIIAFFKNQRRSRRKTSPSITKMPIRTSHFWSAINRVILIVYCADIEGLTQWGIVITVSIMYFDPLWIIVSLIGNQPLYNA